MIDFGALPPEVNSGRMYCGPGAGPMEAAAAGWEIAAAGMFTAAAGFEATCAMLVAGSWTGPSSLAMVAAASQQASMYLLYATQCEHAAAAAWTAAASFGTAFTAHVPPPVIEANRDALTAAIGGLPWTAPLVAELEAQYTEMWAQDASAMYAYAADSQANSAGLAADMFIPAMPVSDGGIGQAGAVAEATGTSAGTAAQTVGGVSTQMPGIASSMASSVAPMATQVMGIVPQFLQQMMSPLGSVTSAISGAVQSAAMASQGVAGVAAGMGIALPAGVSAPSLGSIPMGGSNFAVAASMGNARNMSRLSVPQAWAEKTGQQREQTTTSVASAEEQEAQTMSAVPRVGAVPGASQATGDGRGAVYPPHMRGHFAPAKANRQPPSIPAAQLVPRWTGFN